MAIGRTQRINLGFAAALLLVAVTGVVAYSATHAMADSAREVDRAHRVLTRTERVLAGIVDAETAQRGYVITGDPAFHEPYRAAVDRVARELAALGVLAGSDPLLAGRITALSTLAERRLALVEDAFATRRLLGFDSAAALARSGRGRAVMDTVRATAATLQTLELARLDELADRSARTGLLAQRTVAVGLLLAFLMVLGGVLAVRHEFRVRRRAESALRDSQALLKQFMDTLPIGAFVVDAAGRSSFANTTALAMLGLESLPTSDGRDALTLWPVGGDEPLAHEENPLTLALRGLAAAADRYEIRVSGRALPVEIFAAPVFDSDGRVAYAIAALSDITERKRQQAALRATMEAAEQANEAKSQFLARMSHELRTPLNSIIGFANLLLKRAHPLLPEKERVYLERLQDNGRQLLLLINDILDLARVEAGKIVVEKERVELGPLVAEVLHQWDGPALRGGRVRLEADVPAGASLFTDRVRLRQVLVNLVGNAVKFTHEGSVRVLVEYADTGDRPARIRVVDTGIGIPRARLEAIFDSFEQADPSTARRYGGSGLGLPISRALCHLLGYRLEAASEPGAGSEFTIDLDPPRRETPAPEPPRRGEAPLVLVVDDTPESRASLIGQLEQLGCRAVAAVSPEQALHLARALRPHLITLDLLLHDAEPWEVLARLKADPELAGIPVLAIAMRGRDSTATVLGAVDLLEKPISTARLQAALARAVGGARPERALIVEDEPAVRELLEHMLAREVEEIRSARDGAAALALLRQGYRPDVILLDLLMPVLDGATFLDQVRADAQLRDVPVIVITAKHLSAEEHARLRRAASAVLQKDSATLHEDLRRALAELVPATAAIA